VWLAHKCAPTTQAWHETKQLYFIQIKEEVLLEYKILENKTERKI
jgi:hypothetical protein